MPTRVAKVVWTDAAAEDLQAIVRYLRTNDLDVAAKTGAQLFVLGESLADFPNRGRPISGGRRELVSVPPYVLRYRVIDDRALIISIHHGRRRPPAR